VEQLSNRLEKIANYYRAKDDLDDYDSNWSPDYFWNMQLKLLYWIK
jgi:hypothetical protein